MIKKMKKNNRAPEHCPLSINDVKQCIKIYNRKIHRERGQRVEHGEDIKSLPNLHDLSYGICLYPRRQNHAINHLLRKLNQGIIQNTLQV